MNGKISFKVSALALGIAAASQSGAAFANQPATPIQHLIVVVGENVTFDTLFGAYQPSRGQSIKNLLSQGIINADGTPGPNFSKALQRRAHNPNDKYSAKPLADASYDVLPQPLETGILDPATFEFNTGIPDPRFPVDLPNGPFQITQYVPYGSAGSATGDPVTVSSRCGNRPAAAIEITAYLPGWPIARVRAAIMETRARDPVMLSRAAS